MTKKFIFLFGFVFFTILCYSQSKNNYNLKSVTVSDKADCVVDLSNPDSVVFCNWLCGLRECKDEFCWMTVYTNFDRIFQGIAIHSAGPHNYWIKECTVYDSSWNIIEQYFDSIVNIETLLKIGIYKSKQYLSKYNKLHIISLIDGTIIRDSFNFDFPKPRRKEDKLEIELDCD